MRITFVLKSADRSGGVRVIATYAEALRRRGHEVFLVSCPERIGFERRVKNALKLRGLAKFHPRTANAIDDASLEHHVIEDARPITADDVPDADVIVATWWETAGWVAEMPLNKGEKVYLIQHDETVFPFLDEPQKMQIRNTWQLPMKRVTVSQWIAERIEKEPLLFSEGDRKLEPLEIIANGVDLDRFDAPPRGKNADPTVAMMYSPVPFKATDVGVKALEALRGRIPNLRAQIFGASPIDPAVPIPDWAEFTLDPPQAELAGLYASADAYLFPSRLEGFGLPILEAMACRTPVVGTDTGAARELIEAPNPHAGRVVPVDAVDALADALHAVVTADPDAWRSMSDAARQVAEANAWPAAVDRFEAMLQRVAAGV